MHVKPDAQAPEPAKLMPPHCCHSATEPVGVEDEGGGGREDVGTGCLVVAGRTLVCSVVGTAVGGAVRVVVVVATGFDEEEEEGAGEEPEPPEEDDAPSQTAGPGIL